MVRMEAYGFQDQTAAVPMELDTIFRMASMAKTVFTAAALLLLEDGKFGLDDAVSKWAPELADRRVLRTPDGAMDDTVPAHRPITMFDVLTFQLGIGMYLAPQNTPHFQAMRALGVAPALELVPFGPDEFLSRLGSLPLAHQPGETFMYHTGEDVLRSILPRIAGQSLGEFLHERVFEPLAMVDSGLSVPAAKRHRYSTCYMPQAKPGENLAVWDEPEGRFTQDPIFPNMIVSTAGDYLNFTRMLLNQGSFRGRRFLKPESVALMMTDHLSEAQKRLSPASAGLWQTRGWGMGGTVYCQSIAQGPNAGSYSWFGGCGPHFLVDPKRGSAILLMLARVNQGWKETALGYEFELNTYRDVLSAGNG
jgi:CubicO group peptidase (beta-lactamase class C family)